MILKQVADHQIIHSPTCGTILEILTKKDYSPLGVAVAIDIQITEGHYHVNFDEIYFVLDGELTLQIYDPITKQTMEHILGANELFVVSKGIHHKVIQASRENRLCVITSPPFDPSDQHRSEIIP